MSHQQCAADTVESSAQYSRVPGSENEVEPASSNEGVLASIRDVYEHNSFQLAVGAVILANALAIGLEIDLEDALPWNAIENGFLAVFTLELSVRIVAFGPLVIFNPNGSDFKWHMLDTVIICIGLTEFVAGMFSGGSGGGGYSTVFRVLRIARILRIFRLLKMLRKLFLLVMGMTEAAKATLWVTLLMTFVIYVCGIVLAKTVAMLPEDALGRDVYMHQFSSLASGMFTLFSLMANPELGIYWEEGHLMEYPLMLLFFIIWVVFGSFGMIAMLTGVISESMFEKNQARMREQMEESKQLEDAVKKYAGECWASLGTAGLLDHFGETTIPNIMPLLPAFTELCMKADVEVDDVEEVVNLMDDDDDGAISLAEFTHGLISLVTGSRAISQQEIKHLLCNAKMIGRHNQDLIRIVLTKLHKLEQRLSKDVSHLEVFEKNMKTDLEQLEQCMDPSDLKLNISALPPPVGISDTMWERTSTPGASARPSTPPIIQNGIADSKVPDALIGRSLEAGLFNIQLSEALVRSSEDRDAPDRPDQGSINHFQVADATDNISNGIDSTLQLDTAQPSKAKKTEDLSPFLCGRSAGVTSCQGLEDLMTEAAAMMIRFDATLMGFETVRTQLQDMSNVWPYSPTAVNPGTTRGELPRPTGISKQTLLEVVEAARSESAAIAAASVATERAINLEFASQLAKLVTSPSAGVQNT